MPILDPSAESDLPVVICAVSGLGGIGKTSLALYAGHKAVRQGWFPGGTLFVDFRGYDDNPVTPDQAVLALLGKLGVQGADLPATAPEQYVLYRELLAERRAPMLLVLDNASTASQVNRLIPGTDHHRVLITSRDRLWALDARLIDLDALEPGDAADLIDKSLRISDERDDRVAREPDAVADLARLCGHHPLSLQIVAGLLRRGRFRTIESMVEKLRNTEDRTTALGVRPILEAAYDQLLPEQARLLRLLCLAPTAEISKEAAVALAGLATDQTLALLDELAASRLVTPLLSAGDVRWRLHDLVRAFGVGVVAGDAGLREEGERAREQLLEFYHRWAEAADDRLNWIPGMAEPERFADRLEAWAWLDSERAGLVAAVQWAREERYADRAARLAGCLIRYLEWWRYLDEGITVARTALEVTQRSGDRSVEARTWNRLGMVLRTADRTEEAIEACSRARDLFQDIGNRHGEATALDDLANALAKSGRLEASIEAHVRCLGLYQELEDRRGMGNAWNHLGVTLQGTGRTQEAIEAHTRARDLYRAVEDPHREALAWSNLGLALGRAHRIAEAVEALDHALDIHLRFEDWRCVGQVLHNLGVAHMRDQPTEARDYLLRSAEAFTRAKAPSEAAQAQAAADALT
ncbi:hypothetical protein SGFS_041760 [Streptomyces graminofaciens]|uniref:Uncharacterized protein n=1 Tax=Streptomyces graminofaciens TaxID=68212 RepID=A0ABN5VL93_9ACTN|nr:tetratricopeptide repeat protein [Streptomyces graminofaciens]BBC32882.1 hypothetical protein SGFS_041760 [Streptomyces graminofaciens]